MTAFELVVHHRYGAGTAADRSGHGNDGHLLAPPADLGGQGLEGLGFDGRSTRVVVFPSASLAGLRGIRVRARVRADQFGDRRTIVEGYLAFSLSFDPDGAVGASIFAGDHWHEIRSAPGIVPLDRWLDVAFTYDGLDGCTLSLDGAIVATRTAALGTVGTIGWPYGLNVGAWPDQDLRMFSGRIAELWLWRVAR